MVFAGGVDVLITYRSPTIISVICLTTCQRIVVPWPVPLGNGIQADDGGCCNHINNDSNESLS